jgi:hypothetical protein
MGEVVHEGMTLRDYFAAKALPAILAQEDGGIQTHDGSRIEPKENRALDLQKVRDEALEEAAICAANFTRSSSAILVEDCIRALKSSPAQPVAHYEEQPDGTITPVDPDDAPTTLEALQDVAGERESFDKWLFKDAHKGTYVMSAWDAWQARAALQPATAKALDARYQEGYSAGWEEGRAALQSQPASNEKPYAYEWMTPGSGGTWKGNFGYQRPNGIGVKDIKPLFERPLASQPASKVDAKPFMYAIQEPDGSPHMDEDCVSEDKGHLEYVIENLNDAYGESTDTSAYRVVPVYLHLPESPSKPQLSDEEINAVMDTFGKTGLDYPSRTRLHEFARAILQSSERDKDEARLDFLDSNEKFKMGWQVRAAPAGNLSVTSIIMGGKPIREAIDAAIAASATKGGAT